MSAEDYAALEAAVAIAKAQIRKSLLSQAAKTKEAYDIPIVMAPVAYAAFEILASVAYATGHSEDNWHSFLRGALDEAINSKEWHEK